MFGKNLTICHFTRYKGDPSDIETFGVVNRYHQQKNY